MKALRGVLRELVERRLWPVAALLLVAMVALPIALTRGGAPAPAPVPAPSGATGASGAATGAAVDTAAPAQDPVVLEQVPAADAARKRTLVGHAKDPFRPIAGAAAKSAGKAAGPAGSAEPTTTPPGHQATPAGSSTTTTTGATPGSTATGPGPSSSGALGGTPTTPPVKPQLVLERSYHYYVTAIRFRVAGRKPDERADVRRLAPLPGARNPAAVYIGAVDHGRAAGFLVAVAAQIKHGTCVPQRRDCHLLELRPGHTAHIIVPNRHGRLVHYRLTVRSVAARSTRDPQVLERRLAHYSRSGLCLLAGTGYGAVSYDPTDGSYTVRPPKQECPQSRAALASRARAQSLLGLG